MNRRIGLPSVIALVFAVGAFAEDARNFAPDPTPNTYGTSSNIVMTYGAWNFVNFDSSTSVDADGDYRYITAGKVEAPVSLPNGALVGAIELELCDTSTTGAVRAVLMSCSAGGSGCVAAGSTTTGTTSTPGCGLTISSIVPPLQISNATNHYLIEVTTGPTSATKWGAVRLFYKLQVSPGPAVARFNDVPISSGIYRFVEALAASGITAGCGGGNFCPNDPVTRGQMAVFLASALGLHFPN